MTSIIAIIVSCIAVAATIIFNIISLNRNSNKDNTDRTSGVAVLNSDIGYMKSTLDRIETKQDKQDEFAHDLDKQVVSVEASARSAHHRLDDHETRIVNLEKSTDL